MDSKLNGQLQKFVEKYGERELLHVIETGEKTLALRRKQLDKQKFERKVVALAENDPRFKSAIEEARKQASLTK